MPSVIHGSSKSSCCVVAHYNCMTGSRDGGALPRGAHVQWLLGAGNFGLELAQPLELANVMASLVGFPCLCKYGFEGDADNTVSAA